MDVSGPILTSRDSHSIEICPILYPCQRCTDVSLLLRVLRADWTRRTTSRSTFRLALVFIPLLVYISLQHDRRDIRRA